MFFFLFSCKHFRQLISKKFIDFFPADAVVLSHKPYYQVFYKTLCLTLFCVYAGPFPLFAAATHEETKIFRISPSTALIPFGFLYPSVICGFFLNLIQRITVQMSRSGTLHQKPVYFFVNDLALDFNDNSFGFAKVIIWHSWKVPLHLGLKHLLDASAPGYQSYFDYHSSAREGFGKSQVGRPA